MFLQEVEVFLSGSYKLKSIILLLAIIPVIALSSDVESCETLLYKTSNSLQLSFCGKRNVSLKSIHDNSINVQVSGNGNTTDIAISGSNNKITTQQKSLNNHVTISQSGENNTVSIQQGSAKNKKSILNKNKNNIHIKSDKVIEIKIK